MRLPGAALVEAFITNPQRCQEYQSYAEPQHSKRSAYKIIMMVWIYNSIVFVLSILTFGGAAYYLLAIDSVRRLRRRSPV